MSRIHFKGGAWTNAEDQVLKAALAAYGPRDWQRVASMLVKKTASQCRDRWENFLDPRLHLNEAWSAEEDEQLVQLQTLFPNQWQLIAQQLTRSTPPHFIRPAWLCEQRYLELRDAHEFQKEKDAGSTAETLEVYMRERRRRRGAYQSHEERGARADTVDGERFEREMIDMAISRLANQDQKKGLRRERQRQLEEASFLAKLQNHREGVESGTLSLRQRKKMMRALEEDRAGRRGMAPRDGSEGEEDDSAGGDDDRFSVIDVRQDQASAGVERHQRALMMDLAPSSEERTKAGAAVNQELLQQLAAPVAAAPAAPLLEAHAAPSSGPLTWGAMAEPTHAATDLDAIFGALPAVEASSSAVPPAPADVQTTADDPTSALGDAPPPPAELAAPLKPDAQPPMATTTTTAAAAAAPLPARAAPSDAPHSAAEISAARRLVAVRVLRLSAADRVGHRRPRSSEADEEDVPRKRHDSTRTAASASVLGRAAEDELASARAEVDAAAMQTRLYEPDATATAERDAVQRVERQQQRAAYWRDVRAEPAISNLLAAVEADVSTVRRLYAAAHSRVARLAATCFIDPKDLVMSPYVMNGVIKASATEDEADALHALLTAYLVEYWSGALSRSELEEVFLRSLREKEQHAMRSQLDEHRAALAELQKREGVLQAMYRERQQA